VGLLTDRTTNKSEKSNLINVDAPSRESVPLMSPPVLGIQPAIVAHLFFFFGFCGMKS